MSSKNKPLTVLGFDFGTHSIGVAIGQTITKTAKPLTALKATNGIPNWDHIQKLINDWNPDALVVGIPINMDGTEQEMTQKAIKFSNRLKERFHLPVHQCDERLTTAEAKSIIFEKNGFRSLTKANIDATSAQLILEAWLREQ